MSGQPTDKQIQTAYAAAKERYAALGVDTDAALNTLSGIFISLHCGQGDYVSVFGSPDAESRTRLEAAKVGASVTARPSVESTNTSTRTRRFPRRS